MSLTVTPKIVQAFDIQVYNTRKDCNKICVTFTDGSSQIFCVETHEQSNILLSVLPEDESPAMISLKAEMMKTAVSRSELGFDKEEVEGVSHSMRFCTTHSHLLEVGHELSAKIGLFDDDGPDSSILYSTISGLDLPRVSFGSIARVETMRQT